MTDSFTFPDSAARNSMERSPQSEAILVVNDAPDQLALASAVLRQAGYEVHTAADGRQGIERARQLRPAIVVSDVNMPHLSGIELCRVMHADPDLRHTPVLLMSAMRKDTVSVVEGLKAGAEDYLEAPYEPLRLVAKVTRLLERARVEAHYRDIVEQSADVIYTVDLAGRLTSINRAGAEFAGRAPEALIGVHIGEALGIAAEEVSGGIARLLEHGEPRRELAEARTQGGGRGWLEFSNSLIIGRDGTPVGVRGAARDVTTQQLMASQLRRQADLLDQTFDAIIVSEFRGPIVFWNQGAERLYGYERSVAEGNSRHELLQASHPRGTKDFEDELERTGRWAGELLHATRDGRRIFVESQQALVRQDDEHLYVLEVNRNITDRKRAEEALRESEEKFRTLSEASFEGIALHRRGHIVECNRRLAEMFGYAHAEMIGAHFLQFTAPESRETLTEKTASGDESAYEGVGVRKDGTKFPVELIGKNMPFRGREMRVVVVRDLSERKRSEASLRARAEHDAEVEKMRSLGQLAAGVAHNFNNALAAILGRTQLLLRGAKDEDLRRSLHVIETASRDAAEIVRRIQTFSRRSAAGATTSVSLAELIQDAVQLTRSRWETDAQAHGVTYELTFDGTEAGDDVIEANASELREVFVNLIFNALDAMPSGGRIWFRERREEGEIVIEVSDDGPGIPPDLRERIFEPFFTTKGPQGSGLGLAVSYSIIDRHGGTIEAAAAGPDGRGATFCLRFPAPPAYEALAGPRVSGSLLLARRVLVVDDDAKVRQVLVELLADLNQQVTGVGTVAEALRALASDEFDVMFTDLSMPGTDGLTLAATARRRAPGLWIVLATGYGQGLPPNSTDAGVVDRVINKPFDLSQIEAALQALGDR